MCEPRYAKRALNVYVSFDALIGSRSLGLWLRFLISLSIACLQDLAISRVHLNLCCSQMHKAPFLSVVAHVTMTGTKSNGLFFKDGEIHNKKKNRLNGSDLIACLFSHLRIICRIAHLALLVEPHLVM